MVLLCLSLIPLAALIALVATRCLIALGHRLGTLDSAGVPGQVKVRRRIPNTGGVAIVLALVVPLIVLVSVLARSGESMKHSGGSFASDTEWLLIPADAMPHVVGVSDRAGLAWMFVGSIILLHALGLLDDRRPLGPFLKLGVMAIPSLGIPLLTTLSPALDDTRLLTALDPHVGGPWLSILVTALWFLVVINAMNFMDNMDGLSAGVGLIAAACLLAATLHTEQWFVAATLALVVGALLGFLAYNAPKPWRNPDGTRASARIFMGDGGSLVVGFVLAFLALRTTYFAPEMPPLSSLSPPARPWVPVWAPLTPLLVLAIPLYDFASVVVLRLRQGRSPFVGDLQHFSHRLVDLGLSRPRAVLVIWGFAAVTGVGGVAVVATASAWAAASAWVSTLTLLGVLALLEFSAREASRQRAATNVLAAAPTSPSAPLPPPLPSPLPSHPERP
jgi:UDP-GlcNAc:undecaprenyl-phosphate GlcNAc-1-phosphate transferase